MAVSLNRSLVHFKGNSLQTLVVAVFACFLVVTLFSFSHRTTITRNEESTLSPTKPAANGEKAEDALKSTEHDVGDDVGDRSYKLHQKAMRFYHNNGTEWNRDIRESWWNEDTMDFWKNDEVHKLVDPILDTYKKSSWITVGDGRYGTDARYFFKKGYDVTATDIVDDMLAVASERKFIGKHRALNAENTGLPSGTYDFVYIKEAVHHFPRPHSALHELLRISKHGLMFTEPFSKGIEGSPGPEGANLDPARHVWEGNGNYVWRTNADEMLRVALAASLEAVAFKGSYEYCCFENLEFEKAVESNPKFVEFRTKQAEGNKGKTWNLISVLFLKSAQARCDLAEPLRKAGWNFIDVPWHPRLGQKRSC